MLWIHFVFFPGIPLPYSSISYVYSVKVLRDGRWSEQDASALVPGDIISIKLGDIIPADARLLEGDPLKIDQVSSLILFVLHVIFLYVLFFTCQMGQLQHAFSLSFCVLCSSVCSHW